jgi:glycosyltransferase involved in cell wall biosynthesis
MYLSIIIPLYNEEDSIGKVIHKLLHLELPEFVLNSEIIIVDDCSTDHSFQKAVEAIELHPMIKLLKQESNKGKGSAIRTGIENSSGDVFLIQDADLELCPEDIPEMLKAMHKLNVEFVNGSRYIGNMIRPLSSYKRYLANKFFTILTSFIINVRITDLACGYKLFHRNLYNKLKLSESGFGFETELIIKSLRVKRNNIVEVPVQYFPRNEGEGKKFRNIDGIKILWTIIKYGLFRING